MVWNIDRLDFFSNSRLAPISPPGGEAPGQQVPHGARVEQHDGFRNLSPVAQGIRDR